MLRLRLLDGRTGWVLLGALWLATRLMYLLNVVLGQHYPDDAFFLYAQRFSTGLLPYRNFPVEYPPLGIALIVLPGLVHVGPLTTSVYSANFALAMLALDLLTLFLVIRLARGLIPGDSSGLYSGLLYTAFVAASGAVAQKFDLVAGTFCLVAVVALLRRRDGLAWVMLVLATLTKGFPLALAPLFIAYRLMEGRASYRGLYEGLRAALGSSILLGVPLLLVAGVQPLIQAVVYHVDRGVEIESVYAGILLLCGRFWSLATASYYNPSDQSQDLRSSLDGLVSGLAVPLGVILIGVLYWHCYRALKSRPEERDATLIRSCLLVMLAFMITFRALPGHYLLAILPLAALVRFKGRRQMLFVGVLLGALLLGQLETVFWEPLLAGQWSGILALVARNSAILMTFGVLLGGRMQRLTFTLKSATRAAIAVMPKPSLGRMVESGSSSWQELPVPFEAYRGSAAPLLPAQHFYLHQHQHLLR